MSLVDSINNGLEQWKGVENQIKLIGGLFIIAAIGGYYFYFVRPELTAKIAEQEARIARGVDQKAIDLLVKKKKKLQKEIKIEERRIAFLQKSLPKSISMDKLIRQLDEASEQVGVKIETFEPLKIDTSSNRYYNIYPMKLDLNGTFDSTLMFFDSITRLDRILKIKTVSFGSSKNIFSRYFEQVKTQFETYIYDPSKKGGRSKKGRRGRRGRG